jgi:hypothetical protein
VCVLPVAAMSADISMGRYCRVMDGLSTLLGLRFSLAMALRAVYVVGIDKGETT